MIYERIFRSRSLFPEMGATMADVGATDPENHIFSDIGGVVSDAFQSAGNEQDIQGLPRALRLIAAPGP